MPNQIDQLEQQLDATYQEMKAAFAVIRNGAAKFGLDAPATAPATPITARVRTRGPQVFKVSIASQVRDAIGVLDDRFRMAEVAEQLPDLDRQQISNALMMLKEADEIHIITPGRGNSPALYGKGPAPDTAP